MAGEAQAVREVARRVAAHRQREGAGFIVRRPFPTIGLSYVDPFLLLDEMGPIDYGPGEAVGAPDHPHRGFETVTYVLEGEMEHEDSAGHRGATGPGAVQWMTAGAGVVHSEMPSRRIREAGGRLHGFQVWVNLPARLKLVQPRYQAIVASRVPEARQGGASVRVIAGEALGARGAVQTQLPIDFHDWTLEAGADLTLPSPADRQAVVYVFSGAVGLGAGDSELHEGEMAILGPGDAVRLRGPVRGAAGRALLLAGAPLREPVARFGPFVMNTEAELRQAMVDYQSGRMGEIARTARLD